MGSGEYRDVDVGAHLEAQLRVEGNRRVIGLPRVQEGAITASGDIRNNYRGQTSGEPTTSEVRVSADSTQLCVAGNPHSLSRHGGEPTVYVNSNEATHTIRSFQERSRLGELRQCQH